MARLLFAVFLVGMFASAAGAKNLCIQVDSGNFGGSLLLLKKASLGARKFSSVHGYLAFYSTGDYKKFYPLEGESFSSSSRKLALGLVLHDAGLLNDGSLFMGSFGSNQPRGTITCEPGSDGKINVLDACSSEIDGYEGPAHVVECNFAPPLP